MVTRAILKMVLLVGCEIKNLPKTQLWRQMIERGLSICIPGSFESVISEIHSQFIYVFLTSTYLRKVSSFPFQLLHALLRELSIYSDNILLIQMLYSNHSILYCGAYCRYFFRIFHIQSITRLLDR